MQNLLMTAPTVKEQGVICWDWGEGKAGMIDVRDVVDSAIGACLAGHAPRGFEQFANDFKVRSSKHMTWVASDARIEQFVADVVAWELRRA